MRDHTVSFPTLHVIAVLAMALLATACATPNLKPFAEQTTKMVTAVESDGKAIDDSFNEMARLSKRLQAQRKDQAERYRELTAKFEGNQKSFAASGKLITALLDQAMAYTDQLAVLVEAGEQGKAAADSLLDSVKRFDVVAGMPGLVIGSGVKSALETVASAATRIQAQESLARASKEAQPAVEAVAGAIIAIEDDFDTIALANKNELVRLQQDIAGVNLIGLYEDIAAAREHYYRGLRLRLIPVSAENGFCVTQQALPDQNCMGAQDIQTVAALNGIMQQIEPAYLNYQDQVKKISAWQQERTGNARSIQATAKAWASAHRKIQETLEQCGGLRAMKCREFNPSQLKSLLAQVKAAN